MEKVIEKVRSSFIKLDNLPKDPLLTHAMYIGKSKIFHYYLIFMLCQCVQAKIECVTSIIV